jgi:hypothetical protein
MCLNTTVIGLPNFSKFARKHLLVPAESTSTRNKMQRFIPKSAARVKYWGNHR